MERIEPRFGWFLRLRQAYFVAGVNLDCYLEVLDSPEMRSLPPRLWIFSVLSAFLQWLPFPIAGAVPLWRRYFCWLCLVPLLVALLQPVRGRRLTVGQGFFLAYLCGVLWYGGNCYWIYQTMHLYGDIPELPSFGILVLFSLYLGLYHGVFGGLLVLVRSRLSQRAALLAVPFLWTAVELARSRVTNFPWDLLGYTQVDNVALTALAPLGGVMLLSFVIAVGNAGFAWALLQPEGSGRAEGLDCGGWRRVVWPLLATACLQAGAFYHPVQEHPAQVASLLQENLAVGAAGRSLVPFPAAEKYRSFRALSREPSVPPSTEKSTPYLYPARRVPEMIVWPEAPADFATSDPAFQRELSALASAAAAPVIAGSVGVDFDPAAELGYHEFGSAAVFNAEGRYLGRYDKIHRVPWGEYVPYRNLFFFAGKLVANVGNMEAGTQHTLFALNGHPTGIFICYESIFGDEVRAFVRGGAQLLVNISDDGWYGDTGAPWQHLDMARMRAIENRRWILRDTNTGVTTAIDPYGRGVFTAPRHLRAAFLFPYDYRSELTFYTVHGDWFAWLCALLTGGLVVFCLLPRVARWGAALPRRAR